VTVTRAVVSGDVMPIRAGLGLFLLVFSFYALTGPGHLSSIDGNIILQSARNLLLTGSADVPRDTSEVRDSLTPAGIDGKYYPVWGPGLVLAHLPTLFVVQHLEFLRPTSGSRLVSSRQRDDFYGPFTCAWLMSAAVVGLATCGSVLGFSWRTSLWLASLVAIGSPLWHYARFDTNEPLQCAALIWATCFLLRIRNGDGIAGAAAAGALLGVAVAAKVQNVSLVPWFIVYAAWAAPAPKGRALVSMLVPLAVAAAAIAALNYSRYGSPLNTGYNLRAAAFQHPFFDSAFILLFSLGFGLFTFFPALFLLPLAAVRFVPRFPAESALIVATFAAHFVIDAKVLVYWGCGWGPRFLVPLVPMLALALLPLAEAGGWRRVMLIAGLVVGIGVQAATIPTSFWGQVMPIWGELAVRSEDPVETLIHSNSAAPLRVSLWSLANSRCRTPGEGHPFLTTPPWQSEFPWKDSDAPVRLAGLVGLDLWAAPACLKPQAVVEFIPANPRLFWLLLANVALGAALVGSGLARRDSDIGLGFHRRSKLLTVRQGGK
jgi:hypothetical protein